MSFVPPSALPYRHSAELLYAHFCRRVLERHGAGIAGAPVLRGYRTDYSLRRPSTGMCVVFVSVSTGEASFMHEAAMFLSMRVNDERAWTPHTHSRLLSVFTRACWSLMELLYGGIGLVFFLDSLPSSFFSLIRASRGSVPDLLRVLRD